MLIVLAVIGYYLYQQYFGAETPAPPSCKATLNGCIATCRRTTSEAPESQACQRKCMQEADACKQK